MPKTDDPRLAALLADATPRPWTLGSVELYEGGAGETAPEVTGANGEVVCNGQTYYPHKVSPADAALIVEAVNALDRSAPETPVYRTMDFAEAKRLLEEMAPVVERACVALEQAKRITQKDLQSEVTI